MVHMCYNDQQTSGLNQCKACQGRWVRVTGSKRRNSIFEFVVVRGEFVEVMHVEFMRFDYWFHFTELVRPEFLLTLSVEH